MQVTTPAALLAMALSMARRYSSGLIFASTYDRAAAMWERSATLDPAFPTVWRNLSLAAYNKQGDAAKARECMERAYALDPTDARVLLELDQLYRKLGMPVEERFAFLHSHRETVFIRDDLTVEYCTLLNDMGRYEDALAIILNRKFHPWEGGEGKVTTQYAVALTQLARKALESGDAQKAKALLERALTFPHNLGEGKPALTRRWRSTARTRASSCTRSCSDSPPVGGGNYLFF